MPDREKVISTFEKIISVCKEDGCDFVDLTFEDAEQILALLKEQEDMGKELTDAMELIHKKNERIEKLLQEQEAEWIEYPKCLAYDGAYSDSHIVCSACKHVFSIMDNCTEEFDYCPHCGAKMEGR